MQKSRVLLKYQHKSQGLLFMFTLYITAIHCRQHLSYDGCLEVRGEIIRTVLCSLIRFSWIKGPTNKGRNGEGEGQGTKFFHLYWFPNKSQA